MRWVGVGAAAAALSSAVVTYAGMRTLTDAPSGRRRPRGYHLVARFTGEQDGVVFLSGTDADRPGVWGLVHPDGYAQVGDVLRQSLKADGTIEVVRRFEVLDGLVPADIERRTGDRRSGERRTGDRRTEPEASDEGSVTAPAPVTPRRKQQRRRRSDRRRSRDRRHQQLAPPWPVPARWSDYAFPDDPQLLADRHDADFELDCVIASNGECLPAWRLVPPCTGEGATWMVAVHGRGAPRTEVFRLVDIALGCGIPCMVVSYRTDQWTHAPEQLTALGGEEWEDVAAAMRLLVRDGAGQVVLAGCSLGGAICAQVVRRSAMAPYVVGVVLDSPALSWAPILAHVARGRRLPPLLVTPVMAAARWRADLDWQSLNLLASAGDFRTPILLLHGTEDEAVPVWLSDQLAAARPDLVTYVRIPGARHVEAWNTGNRRYVDAVERFLDATP